MFHLIVAVTATALTAALALTGVFYGGAAFKQAQERAEAANAGSAPTQSVVPASLPSVGTGRWVVTDSY